MSKRSRFEVRVTGYRFPSYEGLIFHSGKFWLHEAEVKEVYNNGSLSMVIHGVKRGKEKLLKQLRKEAVKCIIDFIDIPF